MSLRRVPRAEVLFLESRLSPFLKRALEGLDVFELNLNAPVLHIRPRFVISLLRTLPKASRLAAWITAMTKCAGSKVLVGMDNFDLNQYDSKGGSLLEELAGTLPDVSIFSIQHGQELRRFATGRPKKRVTLLCWGSWVADNFPRFGRNESTFVPVGPLIDGLYRAIRPTEIAKDVPICFVSTVKGPEWWGEKIGERQLGFERLTAFLKRFAETNKISPNIALTIDRDQNGINEYPLERQWFLDRLGADVVFTEPRLLFGIEDASFAARRPPEYVKERYSTYYLCDRSVVTLGMTSSVLWESFGRGNKVLAVNCTENDSFDFPIPGPWFMRQPSYEEFEARLDEIYSMPDEEWDRISRDARQYLIHFDKDIPPHAAINLEIQSSLSR